MIRLPSRSTIFPCTTLFRSYFSCSLWLSPHFRRKFCVRIAQERRLATRSTHSTSAFVFYEKFIKVNAVVPALLIFLVLCGFRHISGENFALGSLRSDDWQLGRPSFFNDSASIKIYYISLHDALPILFFLFFVAFATFPEKILR